MICFDFSPEQEQFRSELRKFAEAELAPRYLARAAKAEFPWDAHRQLAGLGVLGLGLPEKYGGTGEPDPVQLGLVAAQLVAQAQDTVAEQYVPRLINGEIVAATAVTEPSAGSDAANLAARTRPVPGGWRLSGEKIAITHATCATVALVYARHEGSHGHRGISC